MEKPRTTCAECAASLPTRGTGRPRSYCSLECRRAAEYALRRDQSLIIRAERKQQDVALKYALAEGCGRRSQLSGRSSSGPRRSNAYASRFWRSCVSPPTSKKRPKGRTHDGALGRRLQGVMIRDEPCSNCGSPVAVTYVEGSVTNRGRGRRTRVIAHEDARGTMGDSQVDDACNRPAQ